MKRTIIKAKRLLCGALAATMILQSALTYITPEVVYAVEDTDTPDSGDEGDELNNEPNNGVDELEPNDGSDEGITPYSDGDGHWDEGLTVNDGTDKTYYYGQKLVVKYKDDDKMYHGYIKAGEGDDTEQEGTPTEPGKYRISAYTGKTGVYAFAEIEIIPDVVGDPTNLKWGNDYSYDVSWKAPAKTVGGFNVSGNKINEPDNTINNEKAIIKDYTVTLLKKNSEGEFVNVTAEGNPATVTADSNTEYSHNFYSIINESGYGEYKVSIVANTNDDTHYKSSREVETDSYFPKDTISPEVKESTFRLVSTGDNGKPLQTPYITALANDGESGIYGYAFLKTSELSDNTLAYDSEKWTAPLDENGTPTIDEPKLADSEDVKQYYTYKSDITEAGTYAFLVKDKDNVFSTAASDSYIPKTIPITKITYHNFYSGSVDSKEANRVVFVDTTNGVGLATPVRTGYTFAGWHTDSACNSPYLKDGESDIAQNATKEVEVYAKWTKAELTFGFVSDSDHSGIITKIGSESTGSGTTYDGAGIITATVTKPDALKTYVDEETGSEVNPVSYKWLKVEESEGGDKTYTEVNNISGTETSRTSVVVDESSKNIDRVSLDVRNVADSGTYILRAIFDATESEDASEGYVDSEPVTVKISKKHINLTPIVKKISDGEVGMIQTPVPYGTSLEKLKELFTYEVATSDFVGSESNDPEKQGTAYYVSITEGTYSTDYKETDDDHSKVGEYNITATGFSADNYEFTYHSGKFNVTAKSMTDSDSVTITLTQEEGQTTDTYKYLGSGNPVTPTVTVYDGEKPLTVNTDYTLTYKNNTSVSTDSNKPQVWVEFKGDYSGVKVREFNIVKSEYSSSISFINGVFKEDGTFMYDGSNHSNAYSVSENPENGSLTFYYRAKGNERGIGESTVAPKNAGEYTVYAVIGATANYSSVTTSDRDFEITKRPITITSESGEWEYDGFEHSLVDIPSSSIKSGVTGEQPFAPQEGLQSVYATGVARDYVEENEYGIVNEISYEFASGTLAENYEITLNKGYLKINKAQLSTAAGQGWDSSKPGVATWIAVTKDNVDIKYELQLYRVTKTGSEYKCESVGEAVTTDIKDSNGSVITSYDFSSLIHDDLNSKKSVPTGGYAYTLKSIPADGTACKNYTTSDPTVFVSGDSITLEDISNNIKSLAKLYAAEITIKYDIDELNGAEFISNEAGSNYLIPKEEEEGKYADTQYIIQGEKIYSASYPKYGYSTNSYNCAPTTGELRTYFMPNSKYYFEYNPNEEPNTSFAITARASDDRPIVNYFKTVEGDNSDSQKDSVVIRFLATDKLAIEYIRAIANENKGDNHDYRIAVSEGTHEVTYNGIKYNYTYTKGDGVSTTSTIEGTVTVKDAGDYNFVAWDDKENWDFNWKLGTEIRQEAEKDESGDEKKDESGNTIYKDVEVKVEVFNPVNVYKITLNKGSAGGAPDKVVNSGYPEYILKLLNENVTLPDIKNKLYANGYSFTNFKGTTTGLYPNKGTYTANKSDTLTALWSDENYSYTVNYYYQLQNSDGMAAVDSEGNPVYNSEPDNKAIFTAGYNTEILPSNSEIQKSKVGFVRDTSKDPATNEDKLKITENGQSINVYYKRQEYKITYTYKDTDGTTRQFREPQSFKYNDKVTVITDKPSADGYTFIGWSYGDSGKAPETMPENNLTATGYFEPNSTYFYIDTYVQNLAEDSYELKSSEKKYTYPTAEDADGEKDYVSATHKSEINFSNFVIPEIEGFTYSKTAATNGAPSATPPDTSATVGTVSAISSEGNDQTLHIAYYYTRNNYSITLNVYKGGRTDDDKLYTHVFENIPYQTPFDEADGHKTAGYYEAYDYSENFVNNNWMKQKEPNETEASMAGYELSQAADWSTGVAPSIMPAGNITVNRDYVSTTLCAYDIQIYYEEQIGSYSDTYRKILTQQRNEGVTVSIAKSASEGDKNVVTEAMLKSIYPEIAYYELDLSHEGTNASGVVVDSTKEGTDKLVLTVYFKRPACKTKITYRYYDSTTDSTIDIGYLEKTGGVFGDEYKLNVDLFYGENGKNGKKLIDKWTYTSAKIVKNEKGKYVNSTSPSASNIYIDREGNITTVELGNTPVEAKNFADLTIANITYQSYYYYYNSNHNMEGHWPAGQIEPSKVTLEGADGGKSVTSIYGAERDADASKGISAIKNSATVTYVGKVGGGKEQNYFVNIGYYTNDLKDSGFTGHVKRDSEAGTNIKIKISTSDDIEGTEYLVRVANKSDLDAYIEKQESDSSLPKLEKIKNWTNPRTNKSGTIYLAKAGKDGNSAKIVENLDSYFAGNYVYVADSENDLIWGRMINRSYYSSVYPLLGDEVDEKLSDYKEFEQDKQDSGLTESDYDVTYPDAYVYSTTPHYYPVINDVLSQKFYYHYKDPIHLYYDLYGDVISFYYSPGQNVTIADHTSKLSSYYGSGLYSHPGYKIAWYVRPTSSDFKEYEKIAEDFMIEGNTYFDGRYEKDTYNGKQYVYYELANKATIEGVEYSYLTEELLKDIISKQEAGEAYEGIPAVTKKLFSQELTYDTQITKNDNTSLRREYSSTVTTYLMNDEPVLIVRTIPELACSEVEHKLNHDENLFKYYTSEDGSVNTSKPYNGFEYDNTKDNKLRAYCQYEAVNLQAYYKRVTFPLTYDFNDKDAFGNKKTDDIVIDAPYNALLDSDEEATGLSTNPERNGYTFNGWDYTYTKDESGESGTETVTYNYTDKHMPAFELTGTAKWLPATFDYNVFHYFQENDQTYETELVKELDKIQSNSSSPFWVKKDATFSLDGTDNSEKIGVISYNDKKYGVFKVSDRVTAFMTGTYNSDTSKFSATSSDLIGIKEAVKKTDDDAMTSEEEYNCDKYKYSTDETFGGKLDLSMFGYAFTVYRLGADIKNLHAYTPDNTEKYTADVDMDLALYYERLKGINITVADRTTDDLYSIDNTKEDPKETGLTVLGDGSYYYGIGALLSAQTAKGYDFVGFYEKSVYEAHYNEADFAQKEEYKYKDADEDSNPKTISVPTTANKTYVAVSKAKPAVAPVVSIENPRESYNYGYAASAENILSMTVNYDGIVDSSVYNVLSYKWYSCDKDGNNKSYIEGADSATYNVPTGLNAGKYYYGCEALIQRTDNGRTVTVNAVTTDEEAVDVKLAKIGVEEGSYSGIYDNAEHAASLSVINEKAPNKWEIYFSKEPLNAENYKDTSISKRLSDADITKYTDDSYCNPSKIGITFKEVATTETAGVKSVKLTSDGKYAPQYIYYYIHDASAGTADDPVNFQDALGKLPVTIEPKLVSIKPLAAVFNKVYDGTNGLTADNITEFRTPSKYFKVEGILPEHEETFTATLTGSYNNLHVNGASAIDVTVSGIESVTTRETNFNYRLSLSTVNVKFSGQIVPRPLKIGWQYSSTDSTTQKKPGSPAYYKYDYTGASIAPYPVIVPYADEAKDCGVLSGDVGKVTVSVSGAQKNSGSYNAIAQINVDTSNSTYNSEASDYKADDSGESQTKCAYKIINSSAVIKLQDKIVDYDGQQHGIERLTNETLLTLGVISENNDSKVAPVTTDGELITVTGDTGRVSYSTTPKHKNAGIYEDIHVIEGTIKVIRTDSDTEMNTTGNFGFTYENSTLTINKKKVTAKNITASDKIYDANTSAILDVSSVIFDEIVTGDSLSLDSEKVSGVFTDANAGDGKIVNISYLEGALSGSSKDNYELDTANCQKTTTANIIKAELTVSATSFSTITGYTYGGALDAISGNPFADTQGSSSTHISITGFKGDDENSRSSIVSGKVTFTGYARYGDVNAAAGKDFGVKQIGVAYTPDGNGKNIVNGLSSDNYIFIAGDTDTFTVNKKSVSISSEEIKTKVYDGTTKTVGTTAEVTTSNLTLTGVELTDSSNVQIANTFSAVYDYKNAGIDSKHSNMASNITVSNLSLAGGKAANYKLENSSCDLNATISKKTLKVTADNILDVPYGVNPLTGKIAGTNTDAAKKCTVTYDGFVTYNNGTNDVTENKDELVGNLTFSSTDFDTSVPDKRKVSESDSKYNVMPEYDKPAANYEYKYVGGTFNVVPATITVTASSFNLGYKTFDLSTLKSNYSVTVSGWQYGESAIEQGLINSENATYDDDVKDYAVKHSYTSVDEKVEDDDENKNHKGVNSPAGKYPVTIGQTGVEGKDPATLKATLHTNYTNYNFEFIDGEFEIGRRQLIVKDSALVVDKRIYDALTDVRDEQIKYSDDNQEKPSDVLTFINALFETPRDMNGGSDNINLPDNAVIASKWVAENGIVKNLEDLGLKIEGAYADKNAGNNKNVELKLTLIPNSYLYYRYYFEKTAVADGGKEIFTTSVNKKADIDPKPLYIKAKDIEVVYGSNLPEITKSELEVNRVADVHKDSDRDFAVGKNGVKEGFNDLTGTLVLNTNYKISNDATLVNKERITRTPSGLSNSNYNITYQSGNVTVKQAKLEKPKNVIWDSTKPGTIKWDAVSGIGDVAVGGYNIKLYYRTSMGAETRTQVPINGVSGDDKLGYLVIPGNSSSMSYDFTSDINEFCENDTVGHGIGLYTIEISAIPSDDKNNAADYTAENNSKNVLPSDTVDTSTVISSQPGSALAVTIVTPEFASDDDTVSGMNSVKIRKKKADGEAGDEWSGSVVLFAGEQAEIKVTIKENETIGDSDDSRTLTKWTGYTVSDAEFSDKDGKKSAWTVSGGSQNFADTADGKGTFNTVFNLSAVTTETSLKPVVKLNARAATLTADIVSKNSDGTTTKNEAEDAIAIGYKFGTSVAPYVEVTPNVNNEAEEIRSIVTKDNYTYSYAWRLKKGLAYKYSVVLGSNNIAKLPEKIDDKNTMADAYYFECTVTATRNDNGKSVSAKYNAPVIVVTKAAVELTATISNWTYGEERKSPNLSSSHPEEKEPTYKYSATDSDNEEDWVTTIPKDAGDYYVRAYFDASENYDEYHTQSKPFTIYKAKLATPSVNNWEATAGAPYGKASWTSVGGFKENNGSVNTTDTESTVVPKYTLILQKSDGNGGFTDIKTYNNLTDTDVEGYSLLDDINESGAGKYRYSIQAFPYDAANQTRGQSNVNPSGIAYSDTVTVCDKLTPSAGSYVKTYDGKYTGDYIDQAATGKGITLIADSGATAYEWYKNGSFIVKTTTNTYPVFYVGDSGVYSCVAVTGADDSAKYAYYLNTEVTINKRSVTVTAADYTKVYDGTALTKSAYVENADITQCGDHIGRIAYTDASTITNVGSVDNVIYQGDDTEKKLTILDTDNNDVTANYTVSYGTGTLRITKRPVTIKATDQTYTYNGQLQGKTYIYGTDVSIIDATNLTATENPAYGIIAGEHLESVTLESGQIINVAQSGTNINLPKSAVIKKDEGGKVTTDNYSISYVAGGITINPKPLVDGDLTISGAADNKYTYTGSPVEPAVEVKSDLDGNTKRETTLTASDYTVTNDPTNRKQPTATAVGTYTVEVTGKGNYTGTVSRTYQIVDNTPATVTATANENSTALTADGMTYYCKSVDLTFTDDNLSKVKIEKKTGDTYESVAEINQFTGGTYTHTLNGIGEDATVATEYKVTVSDVIEKAADGTVTECTKTYTVMVYPDHYFDSYPTVTTDKHPYGAIYEGTCQHSDETNCNTKDYIVKVNGTVDWDYHYDHADINGNIVSDVKNVRDRATEAIVQLYQNGNLYAERRINCTDICGGDDAVETANIPFEFNTRDGAADSKNYIPYADNHGHPYTYTLKVIPVVNGTNTEARDYDVEAVTAATVLKDYNAIIKYVPDTFNVPFKVTVSGLPIKRDDDGNPVMDEDGKVQYVYPEVLHVKILYALTGDAVDSDYHIISQQANRPGVPCVATVVGNGVVTYEGHYPVWKYVAGGGDSYYHRIMLDEYEYDEKVYDLGDEYRSICDEDHEHHTIGYDAVNDRATGTILYNLNGIMPSIVFCKNDGTSEIVDTIYNPTFVDVDVPVGRDELSKVKAPTRPGYTFAGWYMDPAGLTAMPDIITVSNSTVHVYAKWNKVIAPGNTGDGGKPSTNQPIVVIWPDEEPVTPVLPPSPFVTPTPNRPGVNNKPLVHGQNKPSETPGNNSGDDKNSNGNGAVAGENNSGTDEGQFTLPDGPEITRNPVFAKDFDDENLRLEVTLAIKERREEKVDAVKGILKENEKFGEVFDVNLYLRRGAEERLLDGTKDNQYEVLVPIPEELLVVPDGYTRNFSIVRITEDENGNLLTEIIDSLRVGDDMRFEADTDSTYAIIYDDEIPLFAYFDENGNLVYHCYWHWLIILTALIYMIVLLLTMKRKKEEEDEFAADGSDISTTKVIGDAAEIKDALSTDSDFEIAELADGLENVNDKPGDEEDEFEKLAKKSRNRRYVASVAYVILLAIWTYLGFCKWEIPFDIITGIIVGGTEYGTWKHKFKRDEEE